MNLQIRNDDVDDHEYLDDDDEDDERDDYDGGDDIFSVIAVLMQKIVVSRFLG